MTRRFSVQLGALMMVGCCGLAMAAPAQAPVAIAVLRAIEPGQWELREVGSTAHPQLMCLINPDTLIQLRHAQAQCTRYVVENSPQTATVNYDCDGAGNGRTTISLDTPRAIRLTTQGIAQASPFDNEYAGRRIGACSGR